MTTLCLNVIKNVLGAIAAYGHFVTGPYPFYLRVFGVNCTGSEENLFDCPLHLTPLDVSYAHCAQNEAGVICRGNVQLVYNAVFRSNLTFLMTIFKNRFANSFL